MAGPRHPLMPAEEAAQLRDGLELLPKGVVRFRTDAGVAWLKELKVAVHRYGGLQVSQALGLSTTTVYSMVNRKLPSRTYVYPSYDQMRAVREAWQVVQYLNKRRKQVRRTTPEYERMHHALKDLLKLTDITMIGAALGVEPTRLLDFAHPPQVSGRDRAHLAALYILAQRTAGQPNNDPEFMEHLHQAAQSISVQKLADALQRPLAEIRSWLRESDPRRQRAG